MSTALAFDTIGLEAWRHYQHVLLSANLCCVFFLNDVLTRCFLSIHNMQTIQSPSTGIGSPANRLALSRGGVEQVASTAVRFTSSANGGSISRILAKPILGEFDGDVGNRSNKSTTVSSLSGWAAKNKKSLAAIAIASTAALALPVASHASPLLADLGSMAGGSIDTANTFLEQLSETGFYQAFSLVFLSEIGDKTFFVAGLLAAKLSKFVSFVGSLGALAVMTVLAVLIGQVFHAVPSGLTQGIPFDDICAVAAFAYFGVKILSEALDPESEGSSFMDEELAEAEETVDESDTITKSTAW